MDKTTGMIGIAGQHAQDFLDKRISAITNLITKGEGLENIAWAKTHPLLGITNVASKALGGPSLEDGFRDGVTSLDPTKSKGYAINLPPMRF